MKKILGVLLSLAFVAVFAPQVIAAKPVNSCATIKEGTITDATGNPIKLGYDTWGYNYQARMFNGWYDNASRPAEPETSGDWLMMKWNDAWLSNKDCDGDNKLDRHYGFPSYIGSGAWLTNHAKGTYESTTQYSSDVTNTYKFDILYSGNHYYYQVELVQSGDSVTGTLTDNYLPAQYPDKDLPVSGTVSGNSIVLNIVYPGPSWGTRTYVGTIDGSGFMSGTWSDDGTDYASGTWSTSEGNATTIYATCEWSDFVKIVAVPSDATVVADKWISADGVEIGPVIWGQFAIIQEVSDDPCGEGVDLMNYKSELRSGLGNW